MTDQMLHVLVEGYDEQLAIEAREQVEDTSADWMEVYAARQNGTILQGELEGIESPEPDKTYGIVHIGRIRGYIPMSEIGGNITSLKQFRQLVGKKIAFKVTTLLRDEEQFVASRKAAIEQMSEATWKRLELGMVVIAVVRDVRSKKIQLELGGVTTNLEADEYDYKFIEDLRDIVKVGDHMRVKVISLDKEKRQVKVSAKALKQNEWDKIATTYRVKGEYSGVITGVSEFGTFVNLSGNVDALTPHLKFENVKKGDRVLVRIQEINPKKKHVKAKIVRKLA
ncbi:MAG TPA: 30S ribosomal protein S1 [Bacillus sp. (in: firmicutes)]|nr:30S ribosomal protein S1 [Bacillus sp. (in: firmicutes)]